MTKRWSSTASLDGQTKRQASKSVRAKVRQQYRPEMVDELLKADAQAPEGEFSSVEEMMKWLDED